ncbi:hypothetical protein ACIGKL_06355 [Pseudomonas sp. NPDC077186]|uniref:hypothetical protein n=1 Tax=Pseudomonas sp. NPDC077186 TaxID=3364421 RepID=UPI0037C76C27
MNNTKLISLACFIFIASFAVFFLFYKGSGPHDRVIGVSKGLVEIPCAKPKAGARCTGPDPNRIAFYVKAIDRTIGRPSKSHRYGTEVFIGLFVSDEKIESIYEHGSEEGNYLIGSHVNTVRIYYSAVSELKYKLKWYGHWGDYAAVASDLDGYDKYDDISCPPAELLVSKKITEAQKNTCSVVRRALYVPKASPNKLIDCHQYLDADGVMRLRSCKVHSDLAMGGRAEYSIGSKEFLSGKWVELDESITDYLNGMLIPMEGK